MSTFLRYLSTPDPHERGTFTTANLLHDGDVVAVAEVRDGSESRDSARVAATVRRVDHAEDGKVHLTTTAGDVFAIVGTPVRLLDKEAA